jgi:hypothetical protein
MRASGILAGVVAAILLGAAPAAQAAPRVHTFDGECRMSGELTFDNPLGADPHATAFGDTASGTCTGTLDGVPLYDTPVSNRASGSGTLSCFAGYAATSDMLSFPHGVRVRFTTLTAGGLTQFAARFVGAVSGQGVVHVDVLPYTDQSTLAACQAGGLRSARYDLTARTVTPVSG